MFATKSVGAKKKQLHIENKDDDFIPGKGNFDDPDEYDFMWSAVREPSSSMYTLASRD